MESHASILIRALGERGAPIHPPLLSLSWRWMEQTLCTIAPDSSYNHSPLISLIKCSEEGLATTHPGTQVTVCVCVSYPLPFSPHTTLKIFSPLQCALTNSCTKQKNELLILNPKLLRPSFLFFFFFFGNQFGFQIGYPIFGPIKLKPLLSCYIK